MNRGFFSLIICALSVFALAAIAAYVSSSSFAAEGRVTELDARLAAERADDAARFLNATLADALLDSIYSNCGCGAATLTPENVFSNYSNRASTYSVAAFQNFSTAFVTVNPSFSLSSFSVSSCNSTFQSNATASIAVNSTRAKKSFGAAYSFAPQIYRDGARFNASVAGISVSVRCA